MWLLAYLPIHVPFYHVNRIAVFCILFISKTPFFQSIPKYSPLPGRILIQSSHNWKLSRISSYSIVLLLQYSCQCLQSINYTHHNSLIWWLHNNKMCHLCEIKSTWFESLTSDSSLTDVVRNECNKRGRSWIIFHFHILLWIVLLIIDCTVYVLILILSGCYVLIRS